MNTKNMYDSLEDAGLEPMPKAHRENTQTKAGKHSGKAKRQPKHVAKLGDVAAIEIVQEAVQENNLGDVDPEGLLERLVGLKVALLDDPETAQIVRGGSAVEDVLQIWGKRSPIKKEIAALKTELDDIKRKLTTKRDAIEGVVKQSETWRVLCHGLDLTQKGTREALDRRVNEWLAAEVRAAAPALADRKDEIEFRLLDLEAQYDAFTNQANTLMTVNKLAYKWANGQGHFELVSAS